MTSPLQFFRRFSFRSGGLLVALLIVGAALFRLAVVYSFHAPAGDGLQYHALSQEIARAHRFAYGPPPWPLTYSRLPGYPLFLAYVAVRQAGLGLVPHIIRATQANALLDVGSALLIFGVLRSALKTSRTMAAFCGFGFVVLSPLMLRLSCFALTETLAAFLTALTLFLAVRASAAIGWAAGSTLALLLGAVLGAAQLVRADALSLWPVVLVLLYGLSRSFKRASALLILTGLGALLVFAPWPLRNLQRFGHAYPFSWQWRTYDGKPLPTGPLTWARTWTTGEAGQSYIDLAFSRKLPLDPQRPGILLPAMYDSDEERARLVALFERYNRDQLNPAVDFGFTMLAEERAARQPFRTYVVLPLRRLAAMWQPVAEYELPMRVPWLGLPAGRAVWSIWEYALYGLAAVGFFALRRSQNARWLGASLALLLFVRSLLLCYTVPLALTQRLLAPAMPALLALAACGAAYLIEKIRTWRR